MNKIKFLLKIILWVNSVLTYAQTENLSPRDLVAKSERLSKFTNVDVVIRLSIYDTRGRERQRKVTSVSRTYGNCDKSLIRFLDPPEVAGTGMLIWDYSEGTDDMWIYMPAIRKSRRIAGSEKSGSFMGSEFTHADLSIPDLDDYNYEKSGTEMIDGHTCIKVKGTAKTPQVVSENGYLSKVIYIGSQDLMARRMDYFDEEGVWFKSMTLADFFVIPGTDRMMAKKLEMTNNLNQRRSVMIFEQVKNTAVMNEDFFTVTTLEK